MVSEQSITFLAPALPVMIAAACLLLAQNTTVVARTQAMITALGVSLICTLVMVGSGGGFSTTSLIHVALSILAGMLIASPLLDRARFNGLLFAAAAGGVVITLAITQLFSSCLPLAARAAVLHATLIASIIAGMGGSIILPPHPERANGLKVLSGTPRGTALLGWMLLVAALVGFLTLMSPAPPTPAIMAALTAALITLIATRRTTVVDSLQKTGEAMAAGIVIAALTPLTPLQGAGLGLIAGFFVVRSEAIAQSLRLDDPSHLIGALLLPAFAGLLLPGLMSLPLLAPYLVWLGAALVLGMTLAAILWPLSMLLFGLALPARLVREGSS